VRAGYINAGHQARLRGKRLRLTVLNQLESLAGSGEELRIYADKQLGKAVAGVAAFYVGLAKEGCSQP